MRLDALPNAPGPAGTAGAANVVERPLRSTSTRVALVLACILVIACIPFVAVALVPRLYVVFPASAYLTLHNAAELFSVIVSMSIAGCGWFTYSQSRSTRALLLGGVFLAVGALDFMHALSFPGMPEFITPNSTNKGALFWVAARALTALGLLSASGHWNERQAPLARRWLVLAAAIVLVGASLALVVFFEPVLPAMFVPGQGLTPLKRELEYAIVAVFVVALFRESAEYRLRPSQASLLYIVALVLCIFSELSFTLYRSAYDTLNLVGHIYKVGAFSLIYVAIFRASVQEPYRALLAAAASLERQRESLAETLGRLTEAQTRAGWLNQHDALTGLPNRTLFDDRMQQAMARARRIGGTVALLLIDLDHFKDVNDSLGHAVGDLLLKEIADRLQRVLTPPDTVARMGGDEFLVIVNDVRTSADAARVAERVLEAVRPSVVMDGVTASITASIGMALFPHDGQNVNDLLRGADVAMYVAKAQGRGRSVFFTPGMAAESARQLDISRRLPLAAWNGELRLHYQPVLAIPSGEVIGAEALIRWQHPERGLLYPAEFIDLAEQSGAIIDVDGWAAIEAVRQAAEWAGDHPEMHLSVNVSAAALATPEYIPRLKEAVDRAHLAPGVLTLEITERTALTAAQHPASVFERIHDLGVALAIDDFGTGYSALTLLTELPLSIVKLDRQLVTGIANSEHQKTLVRGVISIAHSMDYTVVAEGVETPEQLAHLASLGCDAYQGFYTARALTPAAFMAFLAQRAISLPTGLAPLR